MKRRELIKTVLVSSVASATIGTTISSCKSDETPEVNSELGLYGRTPSEIKYDQKVLAETYLNEYELSTIATLCDIILPATATAVSATGAGVTNFIEFIVKDLPYHKLPIRGGLMWLDGEANKRFGNVFTACSKSQQIQIIDDIAYPDPNNEKPDMAPGIRFFDKIRGLTLSGYYTSKEGIKDLGYQGNMPNVWDGVPDEVLKKHGFEYEKEWLAKCVDQDKRNIIAEWDDDMNLIT